MLIYNPNEKLAMIKPIASPPEVEDIRTILSGPLQLVPNFNNVLYGDKTQTCIAYVNENGKLTNAAFNQAATAEWERALNRQSQSLRRNDGVIVDYLVGPVVVLFGDDEFMKEL
jgi:hypothetical protein